MFDNHSLRPITPWSTLDFPLLKILQRSEASEVSVMQLPSRVFFFQAPQQIEVNFLYVELELAKIVPLR